MLLDSDVFGHLDPGRDVADQPHPQRQGRGRRGLEPVPLHLRQGRADDGDDGRRRAVRGRGRGVEKKKMLIMVRMAKKKCRCKRKGGAATMGTGRRKGGNTHLGAGRRRKGGMSHMGTGHRKGAGWRESLRWAKKKFGKTLKIGAEHLKPHIEREAKKQIAKHVKPRAIAERVGRAVVARAKK